MHPKRYRPVLEAIEKELEGTSVTYTFTPTSKHNKVRLALGERSRLVVMSASTSDYRALKNQIRDVRHAIHALTGASDL